MKYTELQKQALEDAAQRLEHTKKRFSNSYMALTEPRKAREVLDAIEECILLVRAMKEGP